MENIKVGTGKVCITPDEELLPCLYGLMKLRYAGVIDDIYVRVLLLENDNTRAMFVSWDLDKAPVPEKFVPEIAELANVPEGNILYFSTHTHTAPMHSERPFDGPSIKKNQDFDVIAATNLYEGILLAAVKQAVKEAVRKLSPCLFGFATGKSYIGEYRIQDYYRENEDGSVTRMGGLGSNPGREIDRTLSLLRFESPDGKPLAFLINMPVHCCLMIANNFDGQKNAGISGDIAGNVSRHMEEKFTGSVCLWSSGAAGDINPMMMNQYNYPSFENGEPYEFRDVKTCEPALLMLRVISGRHFADVVNLNRELICDRTEGLISSASITTSSPSRKVTCESWNSTPSYDYDAETEPYHVTLNALKIGDLKFVGANGELYSSLGCAIKEAMGENTVVINHERSVNVDTGYIIDDEGFARCTLPDGSMKGVPNVNSTTNRPGYIKDALIQAAVSLKNGL